MKATVIASHPAFVLGHDEWISLSNWGMFPVRRKNCRTRLVRPERIRSH